MFVLYARFGFANIDHMSNSHSIQIQTQEPPFIGLAKVHGSANIAITCTLVLVFFPELAVATVPE